VDIKSYKKAKADRNGHHLSYCGLMQMSSYHYFSLRKLPGEEKRGKREKTTEGTGSTFEFSMHDTRDDDHCLKLRM
jgi:hypothetical protein